MSRYRKIDPRMWGDEKFRSLSKPQPNAQTLWQYLLTGPHTNGCPGLYYLGEMALAENLGWSLEGLREVFGEVLSLGLAKADFKSRVILIPNALKYDHPESPNVVKYWGKTFDEIPECELKNEYYQRFKAFIEDYGEAFKQAFKQAFKESITITRTITITNKDSLSDQKKRSLHEKMPNSYVKEFIDFYFQEFRGRFDIDPVIDGGKDGALIKRLLQKIELNGLKILLVQFLDSEDPFIKKSGYTIGAFKSQINKLRIGYKEGFEGSKLWLKIKETQDGKEGQGQIRLPNGNTKGDIPQ